MEDLRARALDYLASHNTMTLSTCAGGLPWGASVFYVNDGFTFYFLSDPRSEHSHHIAGNPAVALTVDEDYRDWREIQGLQMSGRADLLSDERDVKQAWRLYLAKYPFVANWPLRLGRPALPGRQHGLPKGGSEVSVRRVAAVRFYRVTATKVLYVDNAMGFGHREEVPIR